MSKRKIEVEHIEIYECTVACFLHFSCANADLTKDKGRS
jgi:hypothetical protein